MFFFIIPGKTLEKGKRKKVQFFIIIVGSTTKQLLMKKKFVKKGCGFGFPSYVIISRLQLIFSCYAIRNNTYEVASLESYNNLEIRKNILYKYLFLISSCYYTVSKLEAGYYTVTYSISTKDWPIKKMTTYEFGYFITIFGHFLPTTYISLTKLRS